MQPTVLFAVLAIGFYINEVASVQIFDLKAFLKTLQQQLNKEQASVNKNRHYSNEKEDTYGSLKRSDLENLLSYSSKLSGKNRQNKYSNHQDLSQYLEQRRTRQNEQLIPNDLTSLLNNKQQQESHYFSSSGSDQRDDEENDIPNEYSKVYVVLNSEAVKKSNNKDKLNALLSGLLSSGPAPAPVRNVPKRQRMHKERRKRPVASTEYNKRGYMNFDLNDLRLLRDHQQGESRYKEFLINARRKGRDSMESMERESRPRNRNRGMRGGGRSGGSARTAIPYVGHHGDIYERND